MIEAPARKSVRERPVAVLLEGEVYRSVGSFAQARRRA